MNKTKKIFLLLILFFQTVFSQKENIIEITDYTTDKVHLLSEEEFIDINNKLKDFELKTTNQVVVVIVKDLGGISIEKYAEKIFNKNKLGQEKEDNGVLLLIAKEDRKLRIEVGIGLEHKLTDAKSSRIIREIITPNFKNNNYYKGINLGINKIISIIDESFLIINKGSNTTIVDDSYKSYEEAKKAILEKFEKKSKQRAAAAEEEESFIDKYGILLWILFILSPFIISIIIFTVKGVSNKSKGYYYSGESYRSKYSSRSSSSYSSSGSSYSSSDDSFSGGGGSSSGGGASGSW